MQYRKDWSSTEEGDRYVNGQLFMSNPEIRGTLERVGLKPKGEAR